jgi:hypothetical protein
MKTLFVFLASALLISKPVLAADNLLFGSSINVVVINTGGAPYVGDDVHCPSIHIHNEQVLAGYTTEENDYDAAITVPVGGQYVITLGTPIQAIVYGAAGATATWSVRVGANTYDSQTFAYANGPDVPPSEWSPAQIYVDGSNCSSTNALPTCYTNINFNVKNNNPDWRLMGAGANQTQASANVQNISPGNSYNFVWHGLCSDASSVQLYISLPGQDSIEPTGITGTPGAPDIGGDGTSTNAPSSNSPTNAPDTGSGTNSINTPTPTLGVPTSNILWSAGSSTPDSSGIIQAIKDAASVAHNDTTTESAQNHTDLTGIAADINGLSNKLSGVSGTNGSGSGSTSGTNSLSLTNYALETTLDIVTNQLGGLIQGINNDKTNMANTELGLGHYTNAGALQSDITAALGGVTTSMGQIQSDVGGVDTGVPEGTEINQTIAAGGIWGSTFNFVVKPETSPFASTFSTMKQVWCLILFLFYASAVITETARTTSNWMKTAKNPVQDLDAFGTNAAGLLVYIAAIPVFLIVLAAAILAIVVAISGTFHWSDLLSSVSGGSMSAFSYMDTGAMHLLLACFPLGLAVSCAVSFILWKIAVWIIGLGAQLFVKLSP